MLCLWVNARENALSPSSFIDFDGAPNTLMFLFSKYSTTPVKSGASVPMKTMSILLSMQALYTSSGFAGFMPFKFVAISSVQRFPGAINNPDIKLLLLNHHNIA